MDEAILLKYQQLKQELQRATRHHSNPRSWLEHEAYKQIVAMGNSVVLLIIGDLKKYLQTKVHEDYPGWWCMNALREITGVSHDCGGVVVEDAEFWVRWLYQC